MDTNAITFLIGRILFGGFFLLSGLNHFTELAMYTQYAASKRVPAAGASVAVSGLLLVLGGVSVLVGFWPRIWTGPDFAISGSSHTKNAQFLDRFRPKSEDG